MDETPWVAERRIPSPEEMQLIIRRAHAQRAQAFRDAFAALFASLKRDGARDPISTLKTVPCT